MSPSPFLALAGAVGETVPQHYGNPIGEQRRLASGGAIVDLSDRGVIALEGPDRLSWLDSLTSQRLTTLAPGESAETLLLDPSGRIEHAMRVVDDGVTAWLLVDEASALAAWLDRMRFMLRVTVTDATEQYATIGTLGDPASLPAAAPNGVPLLWRDPWGAGVAEGGVQYAPAPQHPSAAWTYAEVLVPRDQLATLTDRPVAGALALEALRIEAWRPRLVTERDERTIPHELDWLRSAVHLAKGCYRGQETVAKVHNLGHPPRRLVQLDIDGSEGVHAEHGDEVLSGDTVVGHVTSAAVHHELGPVALAVIKRSTDVSAPLLVRHDDVLLAASQQVIVPPTAGAAASVPRLPRLGAVTRPSA
ncbi:CAF17-like 4Fe-4S cluster assembly/insertion protein YgfZ [Herbiconiux sp. SYSU D00978]|uniref:CAF17-like 4Fe-4S cluster assembly/insertion protein YgfZ n=1 Tax=Herbiconiux sp. SYSU D00978 TaxID=2812562 RepID=UPI001A964F01|nr:folate-binding protein YgfZ [Herbiconiux sp. SYSU D00978]